MRRRLWLMLAALAAVGCGGGGGSFQMPGQKYKTKKLEAEQVVEVDNDTEAWALTMDAAPADQPYVVLVTADQPVGVSSSASLKTSELLEAHKDGKAKPNIAQQMTTLADKKEHTLRGTVGANRSFTILVVRGKGSGPTKVTVKRVE